jgi:SAM-dependent methyltransferase
MIVGDYGGRDYNFLKKFDKSITVIDISKQSNINSDDQIIGDINKNLPFESESFDAVVAFEVIEHLINDSSFLLEVKRILKSDGVFSVSVPFYNDYADFHLRIHSDFTIRRLIAACGFKVDDFIHRGVFLYLNNVIGFIDEKNYLL